MVKNQQFNYRRLRHRTQSASSSKVHKGCMAAVVNEASCWHLSLGRAWTMACLLRHGYDTKQFISWQPSSGTNYNRRLKEIENKARWAICSSWETRAGHGTAWYGSNHIFSLIMILTCFVTAYDTDASQGSFRAYDQQFPGEIKPFFSFCVFSLSTAPVWSSSPLLSPQSFHWWIWANTFKKSRFIGLCPT